MNNKQDKKKRKIKLPVVITVVIIAAMVILSMTLKNREKLPEVTAYEVSSEDFVKEVSANGEIGSQTEEIIYSAVDAAVEAVHVSEGRKVVPGELIIELDRETITNRLANSENALETTRMSVRGELLNLRTAYSSALTEWERASREQQRARELHKIGSISDEDLRQKEEALFVAKETLASARQKLNFREGRELDDPRTRTYLTDSEIVERSPEVRKAVTDLNATRDNLKYYLIESSIKGTITTLGVKDSGFAKRETFWPQYTTRKGFA